MEPQEAYSKAGKIAWKALQNGAKRVKEGVKLLDVAEAVETEIKQQCGLGFPCNISLDNQAAHYTPGTDDDAVFGKNVVKLDVGTNVDGYIGDCAITIDLTQENSKLVEASENALEAVLSKVRAGVNSADLGAAAQEAIQKMGYKPIENLSGHKLEQWTLHAGLTIPSIANTAGWELQEGDAIAIEPFATTGRGRVTEQRRVEIFSLNEPKPVRNADARTLIDYMEKEFNSLPFAERWLTPCCTGFRLKAALRELMQKEVVEGYPILADTGLVSQAEKTIIVTKDSCEVTTK